MSSTPKMTLDEEIAAAVAIVRVGLDRLRDAATLTSSAGRSVAGHVHTFGRVPCSGRQGACWLRVRDAAHASACRARLRSGPDPGLGPMAGAGWTRESSPVTGVSPFA